MRALDINRISKSFGVRPVLNSVSLRVDAGRALALLGPSGCGKTTLLRIVAGLERADAGEINIGGTCVASPRYHVAPEQRGVGMMFQDLALWPHMRAWRQLEFVLRGKGMGRAERVDTAHAMLSRFLLDARSEAYPAAMSGGEQQRLAFARALITEPPLLLLDEPFANLNRELRELVIGELETRMKERQIAVVVATHDPEEVERIASESVCLGQSAAPQK